MFCGKCGKSIDDDAVWCPYCRAKTSAADHGRGKKSQQALIFGIAIGAMLVLIAALIVAIILVKGQSADKTPKIVWERQILEDLISEETTEDDEVNEAILDAVSIEAEEKEDQLWVSVSAPDIHDDLMKWVENTPEENRTEQALEKEIIRLVKVVEVTVTQYVLDYTINGDVIVIIYPEDFENRVNCGLPHFYDELERKNIEIKDKKPDDAPADHTPTDDSTSVDGPMSSNALLMQVNAYRDGSLVERHTFTYNAAGQMTATTIEYLSDYTDVVNCVYTYDSEGRLTMASRDDDDGYYSSDQYVYDNAGRLVYLNKYWSWDSVPYCSYEYSYDSQGRLSRTEYGIPIRDSDAVDVQTISTYEYNDSQVRQTERSSDGSTAVIDYMYNSDGSLLWRETGEGITQYSYDHMPIVVEECDYYGTTLMVNDIEGHPLWWLYLYNPEIYTDAAGRIIRAGGEYGIYYEFTYSDSAKAANATEESDHPGFDETYWWWNTGPTNGSNFVALFHKDGTFEFYYAEGQGYDAGHYQYRNDILTLYGVEYRWNGSSFSSNIQVDEMSPNGCYYTLKPDDTKLYAQYCHALPSEDSILLSGYWYLYNLESTYCKEYVFAPNGIVTIRQRDVVTGEYISEAELNRYALTDNSMMRITIGEHGTWDIDLYGYLWSEVYNSAASSKMEVYMRLYEQLPDVYTITADNEEFKNFWYSQLT